ncbi:MAG: DDE-type integrase/transposase/recombinase, partial [bacterium]|nr:DDE-type integrase/transposase/recombinase [bacterium]
MSDENRTPKGTGGTPPEGSVVDEVDKASRRGGAASSGFVPRGTRRRTARTTKRASTRGGDFTGEERLLILDCWMRSKLTATEFSPLVGVSSATLYAWRRRFEDEGPAGLLGHKRGMRGSKLPEPTKRAILMMKEAHSDWGQDRIHDMLIRTAGIEVSAGAVQRFLKESGYEVEPVRTRPHAPKVTRFERERPNELWQTDLFTFMLKRERRRVHLVCFMDDFSRFIVGFGLHASASGAMVRETFEACIANFGAPAEVLTDNGAQYHTWRGKSAFKKLCAKRGIEQIVASPRRPQTLGKIERFWGTLHRELIEGAIFRGLDEAKTRIGHFIGFYNFQRTHQGIDGLVPADRFFDAAAGVREALQERVAENAKELALHGEPRKPLYLTGQIGGEQVSLHTEGERVLLTDAEGVREEVDLKASGKRAEPGESGPGESELDEVLEDLSDVLDGAPEDAPAD